MNADSNLKEIADKVDKSYTSDSQAIDDITGNQIGTPLIASRSNRTYYFRPVSLRDVPKIASLMTGIQEIINNLASSKMTESEALANDKDGLLTKMAELICMGINYKRDVTVDQVLEEFSIGDFPKAYKLTLDMNDFLSGMNQIIMERMKTAK